MTPEELETIKNQIEKKGCETLLLAMDAVQGKLKSTSVSEVETGIYAATDLLKSLVQLLEAT